MWIFKIQIVARVQFFSWRFLPIKNKKRTTNLLVGSFCERASLTDDAKVNVLQSFQLTDIYLKAELIELSKFLESNTH